MLSFLSKFFKWLVALTIGLLVVVFIGMSWFGPNAEEIYISETKDAAEQGDSDAQFNLAIAYYQGDGVPQDDEEAAKWFRKAAEQGDMYAQTNLAHSYKEGDGVPQDYKEAAKWYRKAAEQGQPDAQFELARCYQRGQGVLKDPVAAYCFYSLVASDEDRVVDRLLKKIAKELTPTQLAEAHAMAKQWVKDHPEK